MKRCGLILMALWMVLLCALPALAGEAQDDATLLKQWYEKVEDNSITRLKSTPAYAGKLVIAIYGSGGGDPETSLAAGTEGFHGVGKEWLADSVKEAETLVIIHRDGESVGFYRGGGPAIRTKTQITVIDLVRGKAYPTTTAIATEPPTTTRNGLAGASGNYLPEKAMEQLTEKLRTLKPGGDQAEYQKAQKLYKAGKYYSAMKAFQESAWKDWRKQANACVQKWPKNKEIWRNKSVKGSDVKLTVKVNGVKKDEAMLVKIYTKAGKLASCLFIGGTGKATAKLPAGTYTLMSGTGKTWFGYIEAFGEEGKYSSMLFNGGKKTVALKRRGIYTITVHPTTSQGTTVGSQDETWKTFAK